MCTGRFAGCAEVWSRGDHGAGETRARIGAARARGVVLNLKSTSPPQTSPEAMPTEIDLTDDSSETFELPDGEWALRSELQELAAALDEQQALLLQVGDTEADPATEQRLREVTGHLFARVRAIIDQTGPPEQATERDIEGAVGRLESSIREVEQQTEHLLDALRETLGGDDVVSVAGGSEPREIQH